jgi:predicted DCC family thiol-disulfide oxidoreductase YuxK
MIDDKPIWLFDGVCVLCSGAVRYVLKHERHHAMRFVAIQSEEGRKLARLHRIDPDDPDSFLFIENGVAFAKSDGVINLARHVNGPARLLQLARVMPRSLRDWFYDRVACNRYRIFGKSLSCILPDQTTRHRFALPEHPQ